MKQHYTKRFDKKNKKNKHWWCLGPLVPPWTQFMVFISKSGLTFAQVDYAILSAWRGPDFHSEAHFFADEFLTQELSGLESPRLQSRGIFMLNF